MKKFFVPLFLALLLSCSGEDFKSEIAASSQKDVFCKITNDDETFYCTEISASLCSEIGGISSRTACNSVEGSSSSDEEEISSSSGGVVGNRSSSSSRVGSSSSRVGSSSSRGSSSSNGSSSSGDIDSSSSSDDDDSSSSGGTGSSSSRGSSSSNGSSSGSSSSRVSSSSVASSSSSAPPSLGECSAFPYYVAKTKKESIKNLVPSNGCGNITYTVQSGGNYASIAQGDTLINFENATASAAERDLTIRAAASVSQCGTKNCPVKVIIADDYRDAKCNRAPPAFPVNLNITETTTAIDYACCEHRTDYYIRCATDKYTLEIGTNTLPKANDPNGTNLPDDTLIEESNTTCPNGILYRYPKRILMTTTLSGGFSCDSW